MTNVPSALRVTPLRPDRGAISVFTGGASEASIGPGRFERLPTPDSVESVALTPRNYETALSLLECAAKALEILYDRRDQLEATIEDVSLRAEGAVVSAQAKMLDWQQVAAGLKDQVQDLERRLAAMQQRAERAESQFAAERDRVEAAERQAAEALDISQGLHSKIMTAFGRSSSAHKALLVAMDDVSGV